MVFTVLLFGLLFLIPLAGVVLSICFCCIKRLRFLASFAFFVPLTSSCGGIAGFWGMGALHVNGAVWLLAKIAASWLGLLVGAVVGCLIGIGAGFLTNWLIKRYHSGLSKA